MSQSQASPRPKSGPASARPIPAQPRLHRHLIRPRLPSPPPSPSRPLFPFLPRHRRPGSRLRSPAAMAFVLGSSLLPTCLDALCTYSGLPHSPPLRRRWAGCPRLASAILAVIRPRSISSRRSAAPSVLATDRCTAPDFSPPAASDISFSLPQLYSPLPVIFLSLPHSLSSAFTLSTPFTVSMT